MRIKSRNTTSRVSLGGWGLCNKRDRACQTYTSEPAFQEVFKFDRPVLALAILCHGFEAMSSSAFELITFADTLKALLPGTVTHLIVQVREDQLPHFELWKYGPFPKDSTPVYRIEKVNYWHFYVLLEDIVGMLWSSSDQIDMNENSSPHASRYAQAMRLKYRCSISK